MKRLCVCLLCFVALFALSARGQLPFFAFCMDTHDAQARTLEEQAALLQELGYDGAGHLWIEHLEERIRTLDDAGLRLFQVYVQVNIAPGNTPYPVELKEALALLAGRETQLALLMTGMPPSDETGDARGVAIVREIADLAALVNVQVVLYPHAGDWLERVEDAIRIADKSQRANVGVMFNLCHWLKVDREEHLKTLLSLAMPRLFAVSINGADTAREIQAGTGDWIQPLDSGSFNLRNFLNTLLAVGYAGPVGLQCYGLHGDARDHLSRSMNAWRALHTPAHDTTTEEGFTALFNGEDLTGWTGDTIGHRIEDGILVAHPLGNLYTEAEFSDFFFRFEFKLTPGANNGIGIRVPMRGRASSDGMEIQLLDDRAEKYADVKPWQRHGSIYGIIPATPGHLNPMDEWNRQEIVVQGTHVRVILNDTVILDADLASFRDGAPTPDGKEHPGLLRESGHISLAGHNTKVFFRNLEIKPL